MSARTACPFSRGERRVAEGAPSAVGHDASRRKTLANVGMPADGLFKQLVAVPSEPAHVGGGNGNAMVLEHVAADDAQGGLGGDSGIDDGDLGLQTQS